MAQASRKTRQIRRLKRERTLLNRMLELSLRQRDEARMVVNALGSELEKREKGSLTITKVKEDDEQGDQANRQDSDGGRLEVPKV